MNRLVLIILLIVFSSLNGFSQDTIYTVNDEVIISKIIEVLPQVVKYKKFDNPDGPLYTKNKSDIKKIVHEDGSLDVFNEQENKKKEKAGKRIRNQFVLHGGLTISSYKGDVESAIPRLGYVFGFSIEIPLDTGLRNYFDFTFLIDQKGSGFNDHTFDFLGRIYESIGISESLNYFSISESYKRYFGKRQLFFGRLGIYAGYLLSGEGDGNIRSVKSGNVIKSKTEIREQYSRYDIGGIIGLGVKIPLQKVNSRSDFIFDVRYNIGLFNINREISNPYFNNGKLFNSGFAIMVGIKFSFVKM